MDVLLEKRKILNIYFNIMIYKLKKKKYGKLEDNIIKKC